MIHKGIAWAILAGLGIWSPLVWVGAYIGSALPDGDTPYSSSASWAPLYMLSRDKYHCHKKVSHSWYACLFFSSLAYVVNWKFGIGVLIGYGSHLLMDAGTRVSLPYSMWPFKYDEQHPYFTGKMFARYDDSIVEEGAE